MLFKNSVSLMLSQVFVFQGLTLSFWDIEQKTGVMFWPCNSVTDPSLPGAVQGDLMNLAKAPDSSFDYSSREIYFSNLLKGAHVIHGMGQDLLF